MKKVISIALVFILAFALSAQAFAATVVSKEDAAVSGAKAAYYAYTHDDDNGVAYNEDIYNAFKITKMVKADGDADYKYDVTVRSGYEWVYTCKLDVIETSLILETTTYFVTDDSGAIEHCNQLVGFFGTIFDAIINFFSNL